MNAYLKPNIPIIILMSISLFFTQQAFALAKVGHKVVCQLAFDHATLNTQNKINNLLKHLPQKHITLINTYNHEKRNNKITFAKACTWADAIKRKSEFDQYKKWHYINIPRNQTQITPETCNKNCITTAINLHTKQLSELAPSWEKLQALMFLGHWLGDIHQPMHVNYKSDLGGNRTKIKIKGIKCNNMHWLWDDCLLNTAKVAPQILFTQLHQQLSTKWDTAPIEQWQKDSLYVWATESLTIARLPSVSYCALNKSNDCLPLKENKIQLPYKYLEKHSPILKNRLLQASARLVGTLEDVL